MATASAPRTRSMAAKNEAAARLLRLSRAGFLPELPQATFRYPRQKTRDALNTRFSQPPRYVDEHNLQVEWSEVSPGKRIVAHLADWAIARFGENCQIVEDIWRLLPFIREPPGFSECPPGWEIGIDSMGRKFYKNRFTGATQLSRPQSEQWMVEEDGGVREDEAASSVGVPGEAASSVGVPGEAAKTQTTTENDPEWRPWAETHLGHSPQRAAPVTRRDRPVTRSRSQTPQRPASAPCSQARGIGGGKPTTTH